MEWMLNQRYPKKILNTSSMKDGFRLFSEIPTIGNFLAYQYITDISYSELTEYTEKEFVVPGSGVLDGIAKCFVNTKRNCC